MNLSRLLPSRKSLVGACVAALGVVSGSAFALPTLNLTDTPYPGSVVGPTDRGTITNSMGTVTFQRDSTQPAGTGVFNPFLRLDVKGNRADEQGYNTSAKITEGPRNNQTTRKVLDNMSPENWTHDVLISSLQLDSTGAFYQFKLDINEPGNGMSLLSLDGLRLYSTSQPSQSSETLDQFGDLDAGALRNSTLLWDMDAGKDQLSEVGQTPPDNSVLLDARLSGGPGSGIADMVMLVPKEYIDDRRRNNETYLVLWSRFGLQQGAGNQGSTDADAGFEEWSYAAKTGTPVNPPGPPPVPEPGTALLALAGLGLLHMKRKRAAVAAAA